MQVVNKFHNMIFHNISVVVFDAPVTIARCESCFTGATI